MTPSASLLTFIASTGLAGLTLAFLQDCAKACRPIALSFNLEGVDVVLPGRRAVSTVVSAYPPIGVQGQCLRVREQWSTDPWARASSILGQIIQGERA